MNRKFKEEFKNLNAEEIKDILNGCGEYNVFTNIDDPYFIKFIDDDQYGFWTIQWGMQKCANMTLGSSFFKNSIKVTPFKLEFEISKDPINPYVKPKNRKSLEEYLQLYINKKCPHYTQAIREETEKFIQRLEMFNSTDSEMEI